MVIERVKELEKHNYYSEKKAIFFHLPINKAAEAWKGAATVQVHVRGRVCYVSEGASAKKVPLLCNSFIWRNLPVKLRKLGSQA